MEKTTRTEKRVDIIVRRMFIAWMPSIVWMVLIFFLSSRHSIQVSPEYVWNFLFFKSLHVIEYFILFTLNVRAVHLTWPGSLQIRIFTRAFIFTILFAATDEYHQLFVPSRTGQPRDVIIDTLGATLSWLLLQHIVPYMPKKLRVLVRRLDILS